MRTPTRSPATDAGVHDAGGEGVDLANETLRRRATVPSSSAASSGWVAAVAWSTSTSVRGGRASDPRSSETRGSVTDVAASPTEVDGEVATR